VLERPLTVEWGEVERLMASGARPQNPVTWVLCAASVMATVALSFSYGFVVELSAFWFIEIRGLQQSEWLARRFCPVSSCRWCCSPTRAAVVRHQGHFGDTRTLVNRHGRSR
jgi:hypothetical protein